MTSPTHFLPRSRGADRHPPRRDVNRRFSPNVGCAGWKRNPSRRDDRRDEAPSKRLTSEIGATLSRFAADPGNPPSPGLTGDPSPWEMVDPRVKPGDRPVSPIAPAGLLK